MYLRRKIDKKLDEWLLNKNKTPILIVGIRQCGKTESVKEFAKRNNLALVEVNFMLHPEYCDDFNGDLSVETIISNLSLRFPNINFNPNKILLFFDEIQDCPRARLSFKSFKIDGRYNVLGSGSYLGINGYIHGDTTPAPTGYDDFIQMMNMDFEEFLWALGYKEEQINLLVDSFIERKLLDNSVYNLYKNLYLKYACIGGFPKAVITYVETKNIMSSYKIVENIVLDMKSDFGRRKGKNGEPIFKASEVSRIQNVFENIPLFLAKENKRYIVSKIKSGNSIEKNDAIEYLRQAHIVYKVFNLETPSLPFTINKIDSQFKLFPADIGITNVLFGLDSVIAMNQGNLGQAKGAIYESLVFDSLIKSNIVPYYFAKSSGLEIDFVISYKSYSTLIEAKAKTGNTKSSKTVMMHPEHYGKTKLIKVGDYNISENGDIITIPHFMVFVLGKTNLIF